MGHNSNFIVFLSNVQCFKSLLNYALHIQSKLSLHLNNDYGLCYLAYAKNTTNYREFLFMNQLLLRRI